MEGTTTTTPTFFYIENFFAGAMNGNLVSVNNSKKPKRGFVFCPGCGRPKQLFKSQKEAELFLHYNQDAILDESGYCPVRAYYCEACGGWHVTSQTLFVRDKSIRTGEKGRLTIQHKKDAARRLNISKKLDRVEVCVEIAIGNFRKNKRQKAYKHLRKAFQLFQQTMKSECLKSRKLALFNQISICQELLAA